MFVRPDNWKELSSAERRELRLASWASTKNKQFETPQAEETYRKNAARFADIIRLKQPDRVPIMPFLGHFIGKYGGIRPYDVMYHYDMYEQALIKFCQDFRPDYQVSAVFLPGRMFDAVDYQSFAWPSHGVPPESPFQYVEGEYMLENEYEEMIADPEAFLLRKYIPRAFKKLKGLELLPTLFASVEMAMSPAVFAPIGAPPMQEALQALLEAGKQAWEWSEASARASRIVQCRFGMPPSSGGFSKAPFDFPADTLRGTRAIMIDLHRKQKQLLEVCERLVPIAIKMGVESATQSDCPMVMIPLHKGADDFISGANFKKFYWPTFKATLLGLIEEGIIPFNFVEGAYNRRLEIIRDSDIPAGSTYWSFDKTDMAEVKKHLGGWAAFGGNVPGSLIYAGTTQQMEDYVKKLIDTCAPGGGFALSTGVVVDDAKPENLHAMFDTGRNYGVYK
jgi:hypothetical protein